MESGLERLDQQLRDVHYSCYERIRKRFSDYSCDLLQTENTYDIVPLTNDEQSDDNCDLLNLENGLRIVVCSVPSCKKVVDNRCGDGIDEVCNSICKVRIEALSGGQQALLGLALVFACSLSNGNQRSPLYILDEVAAYYTIET